MAFFPQENAERLALSRGHLTPFLKAVTKALSFELENGHIERYGRSDEYLFNEILQNLPAENSTHNFFANWNQGSDTLQLEFVQLLNLR